MNSTDKKKTDGDIDLYPGRNARPENLYSRRNARLDELYKGRNAKIEPRRDTGIGDAETVEPERSVGIREALNRKL